MAYVGFGMLFFGQYIMINTKIISSKCNDTSHNCVNLDFDDFVLANLMLYLDVLLVFIYILRLLSDK